jgi:hypothetical protein
MSAVRFYPRKDLPFLMFLTWPMLLSSGSWTAVARGIQAMLTQADEYWMNTKRLFPRSTANDVFRPTSHDVPGASCKQMGHHLVLSRQLAD